MENDSLQKNFASSMPVDIFITEKVVQLFVLLSSSSVAQTSYFKCIDMHTMQCMLVIDSKSSLSTYTITYIAM